jgi:hypothetical protein
MKAWFMSLPLPLRYVFAIAFTPIWMAVSLLVMVFTVLFQIVPWLLIAFVRSMATGSDPSTDPNFDRDTLMERWFDLLP